MITGIIIDDELRHAIAQQIRRNGVAAATRPYRRHARRVGSRVDRLIAEAIQPVLEWHGYSLRRVCSKLRWPALVAARDECMRVAVEKTGATKSDVARFFGVTPATVLNALKKGKGAAS